MPHSGQWIMVTCFCRPSVMSTWDRRHLMHMLAALGCIGMPQMQHRTLPIVFWGMNIPDASSSGTIFDVSQKFFAL